MTDKLWHEPDYPLTPQHAVKGVRLITKSGQVLTWSIEHGWKHVAQNNEPFIFFEDAVKMICNYAILQKKLDKAMAVIDEITLIVEERRYAPNSTVFTPCSSDFRTIDMLITDFREEIEDIKE